jgi:hypothetical protein
MQVIADGLLELHGAAVSAAADLALRERGEPALDLVEPGGRGPSEVHVEARVAIEPSTQSVQAAAHVASLLP